MIMDLIPTDEDSIPDYRLELIYNHYVVRFNFKDLQKKFLKKMISSGNVKSLAQIEFSPSIIVDDYEILKEAVRENNTNLIAYIKRYIPRFDETDFRGLMQTIDNLGTILRMDGNGLGLEPNFPYKN